MNQPLKNLVLWIIFFIPTDREENICIMKAGGSLRPASHETVDAKEHFIYQEGQSVFKFAVSNMADVAAEIMERNNLKSEDIAWLVPHQANLQDY